MGGQVAAGIPLKNNRPVFTGDISSGKTSRIYMADKHQSDTYLEN